MNINPKRKNALKRRGGDDHTKIEAWKANDNSLHGTFEAAQRRNFDLFFQAFNTKDKYGNKYFTSEAIEKLWINRHNLLKTLNNMLVIKDDRI